MAHRKKSRHKKIYWLIAVLIFIVVGLSVYYISNRKPAVEPWERVETEELTICFPELGNKYAGDCTLIKVGDTEILIDAGSRQASADRLGSYIDRYCTDGVLEFVVATHAHQDHIAAFVGANAAPGIFARYECKTIIDFARTNADSKIYYQYVEERDKEVAAGAVHYTALQCWNETDGARRTYEIAENISMSILYQRFYEEHTSDENNYSVCILLSQGADHYLFTGDLEEAGEKSLAESNELPACKLFKGGHHGSYTASNDVLLAKIKPENVVVCCCAGSPEYTEINENTFPAQAMIDRVARYTKNIYVTTLATDVDLSKGTWNYTSMNGDIVFTSNGTSLQVRCSHNDILLKDTEWFHKNRTWPSYGVQ